MLRYALTIFVSAFLLFQVQPLIGRFILPWFGGGPSIWTTCMLFFQVLLLGGYLYAHLISVGLSVRTQVLTHVVLLAGSLFCLPIAPSDAWKPVADGSPSLQILLLLLATVGGPYFMLASTGPLMQRWFSRTEPGKSPYRLYSLSNVGSLLALLSYPFVFEPMLKLKQQASNWGSGYMLYVALATWCGVRLLMQGEPQRSDQPSKSVGAPDLTDGTNAKPPSWGAMLLWLGLAAFGSAMLLATTNQLCIDVATVPFLWVLPLSLYLLTFIICFDNPEWYDRRIFGMALLVAIPAAIWVLEEDVDVAISDQIWIYSAVLFACCMTCHGELVNCRPHPKYLTLFFVLVSAGGAIGGLFVAIFATRFFQGYWEYHISLVGCCAMTLIAWCVNRVWQKPSPPSFWIWSIVVVLQASSVAYFLHGLVNNGTDSLNVTIYFGVYLLIQFFGLGITSALQNRHGFLYFVWFVLMLVQIAWLAGYANWRFPDLMSRHYGEIVLGASLPALIGNLLLCIVDFLPAAGRRTLMTISLWTMAGLGLIGLWHHDLLAPWQVFTIAGACLAALLIEGTFASQASFWIWSIVVILQAAAVAYFIHGPVSDGTSAQNVKIFFEVYLLIQCLGLAITSALHSRHGKLYFVWPALMILQIVWLAGFAAWRFSESMSSWHYGDIVFGVSLPVLIGSIVLWAIDFLPAAARRCSMMIAFGFVAALGLFGLWYREFLAPWQVFSIAGACLIVLVISGIIEQFRGSSKPSLGFFVWIPAATMLVLAAIHLREVVMADHHDIVHLSRNFYGVLRVRHEESDGPDGQLVGRKVLTHGQIQHGLQYEHEYWGRRPTTYYGLESGFGLAMRLSREKATAEERKLRVGVVGLGTGTTAAYGEPGEYFRFYDINAAVLALSVNNVFTYLRESQAKSEVVLGDARIVMERELAADQSQQFDVLAIDAFSSDAIPVHLLTTQCADIYAKQLRPGGILAVHISNRFLDLNPISRGMAEHMGWTALQIENDDDRSAGVYTSTWILLTNNANFINDARIQSAVTPWKEDERTLLWTDDYSGLWQVLSF